MTRPRPARRDCQLDCVLIAHGEPAYPQRLAEIADPPPVLIVRGRAELLAAPAVAVVGARNASANGRMLAHEFVRLAAHGLLVVSGLARGIDGQRTRRARRQRANRRGHRLRRRRRLSERTRGADGAHRRNGAIVSFDGRSVRCREHLSPAATG